MAKCSNSARESLPEAKEEGRCEVEVELHQTTTIQGWALKEPGRCLKHGKVVLRSKNGVEMRFCGAHKRMALEGKVGPQGATMTKADRSACYMHDIPYFYKGTWNVQE